MRARLVHVVLGFVIGFAILAVADARLQLGMRSSIESHPGDPRNTESIATRGTIFDAAGTPLARSVGDRREYLAGSALAQIVGYASPIYGDSGLEAGLDGVLAGRSHAQPSLLGTWWVPAPAGDATGGDVVLTLRSDIAAAVDAAMPQDIRGSAVVVDPRTGAILAIVNRPSFDPNRLEHDWAGLRDRADAPLLDRGLDGLYPPGSTFKTVTVSAALDSGTVSPDDTFVDPGYVEVDGFRIHNDE
ncbi:MAG TPA: penicillin-binding transpeptidase domain-containing protein, partial [Candidatus Eremiobacteraceae bacterium]|nr:penicillin-binding transpeptidase domain-containing protein [Candidatus Eremiobacteraceae bacterium]